MAIEKHFDIPLIATMALKEKQIQQNYRPIIAVHKWFARRPGTLFRGLLLSEFSDRPIAESFFRANDFPGRVVADPFMGGGTPLIEANRVGCDVLGFDINPMAVWIVREEIEHLDLDAYRRAADELLVTLEREIGAGYRTDCPLYGDRDLPVKYFLWVKVIDCAECGRDVDLFPGYLIADDTRHPKNVLVCPDCRELNEVTKLDKPGKCGSCGIGLANAGPARRNRCTCRHCGHVNAYPRPAAGPLRHRMFAIEYYNAKRKDSHIGRFFKRPDAQDLARAAAAAARWQALESCFVPAQEILPGDETDRLHRWGYTRYRDLFNERQLLGLELSCRLIADVADERVRHALATNLSDLLRYQNMLCRYDTMALKSLDIFSVHGFPVGLVQCESNLLGIANSSGVTVGSGGWNNIVEKYAKAKRYCDAPFETRQAGSRKVMVPIKGEWIGDRSNGARQRSVRIRCGSSTRVQLEPNSLDAVFTDPPYFGNVQYGELMDFCYVWLRRLIGTEAEGFDRSSTRSPDELTGNETEARGLNHFTDGLAAAYLAMARALKPGAPLAFTFHHNRIEVYYAVGVAILDAGLVCSATLPCPAEMGGSIHIHGTGSSIVDTVFVCRSQGRIRRSELFETPAELAQVVRGDLDQLRIAGMKPTAGDIRCIVYGHLTRIGVWKLRQFWHAGGPTRERLARFADALAALGDPQAIIEMLARGPQPAAVGVAEPLALYAQGDRDAVSF
jgi:adenine-specific DNA methylase